MTKAEFRSLIRNHLRKFDVDIHPNVVDKTIDTVFLQVFNDLFRIDPGSLDGYTTRYGPYTGTLDVDVYYIDLPVSVYNMPDKAGGVRRVFSTKDIKFFPSTRKECELWGYAENAILNGDGPYIVKPNKVEFVKDVVDQNTDIKTAITTDGVYMDLLQMFSSYENDDEVPLPFGRGMDIEKFTLLFLNNIQPPDQLDNNRND